MLRHRGDGRLGVAVQLCSLRWLGFVPAELAELPQPALLYLCEQLGTYPDGLASYGARSQTRSGHLATARAHAGFAPCRAGELAELERWRTARAMEHERPKALFSLAAEELRSRRIERPSVDGLARLIGSARERAHQATFDALASQLGSERRAELDALLSLRPDGRMTWLEWLRTPAQEASPSAILRQLEKLSHLRERSAEAVALAGLPPGRVRMLAGEGRRRSAWELCRLAPSRRYPVLLCFLAEMAIERGDELIELYGRAIQNSERRARESVARERERTARARDDHAALGRALALIVVDALDDGSDPTLRAVRELGEERLRAAAHDPNKLTVRIEDQRRDALGARHAHLARFAPALLAGLDLCVARGDEALLEAIHRVGTSRHRTYLDDARLEVLPRSWRGWVCV